MAGGKEVGREGGYRSLSLCPCDSCRGVTSKDESYVNSTRVVWHGCLWIIFFISLHFAKKPKSLRRVCLCHLIEKRKNENEKMEKM